MGTFERVIKLKLPCIIWDTIMETGEEVN